MNRRLFLQTSGLLTFFILASLSPAGVGEAYAKDSDDSDDDDDDDDNSGSGSSNSGSGKDDDDDDDDDKEDDDDDKSQKAAKEAVGKGSAIPLKDAVARLAKRYPGRVIDVDLRSSGTKLEYRFKVRQSNGKVKTVYMDARSGRFLGLFGRL